MTKFTKELEQEAKDTLRIALPILVILGALLTYVVVYHDARVLGAVIALFIMIDLIVLFVVCCCFLFIEVDNFVGADMNRTINKK